MFDLIEALGAEIIEAFCLSFRLTRFQLALVGGLLLEAVAVSAAWNSFGRAVAGTVAAPDVIFLTVLAAATIVVPVLAWTSREYDRLAGCVQDWAVWSPEVHKALMMCGLIVLSTALALGICAIYLIFAFHPSVSTFVAGGVCAVVAVGCVRVAIYYNATALRLLNW